MMLERKYGIIGKRHEGKCKLVFFWSQTFRASRACCFRIIRSLWLEFWHCYYYYYFYFMIVSFIRTTIDDNYFRNHSSVRFRFRSRFSSFSFTSASVFMPAFVSSMLSSSSSSSPPFSWLLLSLSSRSPPSLSPSLSSLWLSLPPPPPPLPPSITPSLSPLVVDPDYRFTNTSGRLRNR